MLKDLDFCQLEEIYLTNVENNYLRQKKVAHNAGEATVEFLGNKIVDKIVKPKAMLMRIQEMVKKYNYSTQRKEKKY